MNSLTALYSEVGQRPGLLDAVVEAYLNIVEASLPVLPEHQLAMLLDALTPEFLDDRFYRVSRVCGADLAVQVRNYYGGAFTALVDVASGHSVVEVAALLFEAAKRRNRA